MAQIADLALLATADDGGEGCSQPGVGIDAVEFAGLDERGDDGPVFCAGFVTCEEGILQDDEPGTRRTPGTKRYFTIRSCISNSAFDVSISGVAAVRVQR